MTCSQIVFLGMLEVNTITDDRQMRTLTELDLTTFYALAEPFTAGCQTEADAYFSVEQPRQRRPDGGCKGVLASPEQKLLFILFYLKTYPTFDVLKTIFGLPRSKVCEHAHRLAKALERCLRTSGVLRGPSTRWPRCRPFLPTCRCCCSTPPNGLTAGRTPPWTGWPTTRAKKAYP